MSSRKIRKTMQGRSDGQIRRRSPRISALDASKENHQTRSRVKRKFDHAPDFTGIKKIGKQVWKGKDEHHSSDCVEWRCSREPQNQRHGDHHALTNGKPSILPSKHILELVVDTLQRRDTYEIFAEPVDPDEVEDYYEIIKEPMDFGTMRAKLHEGMYHNLEQFEHDVFLIPENAMYFNSSATVYSRQGRSIHELAKKVFDALKTDPEKFVLEFSGTRRRSMRKALSNTKDSRLAANLGSGIVCSKESTSDSPLMRRATKNSFAAMGEAADRRFTYWAGTSNNEDKKSLLPMNVQGDIKYKDSLMSYVKDLGPVAQMVAKRKLNEIGSEKCESAKVFKTFGDFARGGSHPFLKASKIVDLTEDGENGRKQFGKKAAGKEKSSSNIDRKNLNCSSSSSRSNNNDHSNVGLPVILALDNSHSNVAGYKSRNSHSKINRIGRSSSSTTTSQFTFDLPFLRARLNQMNHHHSINCTRQAEPIAINPFLYTPSFNQHDTNLALQL